MSHPKRQNTKRTHPPPTARREPPPPPPPRFTAMQTDGPQGRLQRLSEKRAGAIKQAAIRALEPQLSELVKANRAEARTRTDELEEVLLGLQAALERENADKVSGPAFFRGFGVADRRLQYLAVMYSGVKVWWRGDWTIVGRLSLLLVFVDRRLSNLWPIIAVVPRRSGRRRTTRYLSRVNTATPSLPTVRVLSSPLPRRL